MSDDAAPQPAPEDGGDTQPKLEKGEPIGVIVKDQHGHQLHFKVRKTTKFDKASLGLTCNGRVVPTRIRSLFRSPLFALM